MSRGLWIIPNTQLPCARLIGVTGANENAAETVERGQFGGRQRVIETGFEAKTLTRGVDQELNK